MATPLWLSDNIFDEIGASPGVILDTGGATDDAPGAEVWRVADGLRDRTWWTVTTPNVERIVRARSTVARAVDTIVLDRGHNLAGVAFALQAFDVAGSFTGTYLTGTVRATVGGLPSDANGCLLPTGEWWKTFGTSTQFGHAFVVAAMGAGRAPLITGLALGQAYRWPSHWDAPSAYDDRRRVSWAFNRESEAGVRVRRGRRVHRRLAMRTEINGEDWTAPLQAEFDRVVDRGLPVWHCTDDATAAGAGALGFFHVAEEVDFDPIQNPVHRELQLELDEVAPVRQR
jgi:hypothetical protein